MAREGRREEGGRKEGGREGGGMEGNRELKRDGWVGEGGFGWLKYIEKLVKRPIGYGLNRCDRFYMTWLCYSRDSHLLFSVSV